MPYCALQDLIDEFGETELIQLTDEDRLGVVNEAAIDKAIARADRTINRYLSSRDLPVDSDGVVDLACDIARYHLYANQVTELVKERYNNAIKQLEKMANRTIAVADTAGQVAESATDSVQFSSNPSVFGRD